MARPVHKLCIAIVIAVFALSLIQTKGQEFSFRHLTTEDGLPTNYTQSVLKDTHGFIWIATRAGICRYDGYNMKVFQYDPDDSTSLSDNQITRKSSMIEDDRGRLWIATSRGLNRFDPYLETFKRYQHDPDDPSSVSSDNIYCLYTDRSGILWIGTEDRRGLNRYDPEADNFTAFQTAANEDKISTIMAICEDRSGIFWVAAADRLYHFDRKETAFTLVDHTTALTDPSKPVFFKTIYEHPSGRLFFGTSKGLLVLDQATGQLVPFSPFFDENAFFTDLDVLADPLSGDQVLWIAGWNLYRYDWQEAAISQIMPDPANPAAIRGNMIYALYGDQAGLLWITSEFGVNILDPLLNQIPQHRDFAAMYQDAMSFLQDSQGHTWIGTRSSLVHFDERMNLLNCYDSLPVRANERYNGNIWSIYEDSGKNLWIGTEENGLFVREFGKSEFAQCSFEGTIPQSIPVFVWKITEDSRGNLWICTLSYGLFRKEVGEKPLTFIGRDNQLQKSLSNALCRSVYEDHGDNLWMITQNNGLFRQPPELRGSYEFIQYKHLPGDSSSISSDRVWCIGEDSHGKLWIGTGDGLNLYHKDTDSFQRFRSGQDKGANVVYNFVGDDSGILWLTTEGGLIRFDPASSANMKDPGAKASYKKILPFNDIIPYVIYKSNDGRIFLGGSYKSGKGYYDFHPDSLRENKHIPPISLVDFRVRGEPFALDTSITMKKHIMLLHHQNFFSFEYAALNYSAPELNEYSYRLEGLDEDWNNAGSRRYANYTGVPPGNYIFRVKGSNNNGYWNEEGTSISITILKPPWRSWWANLFYVVFTTGVLATIIYYYLKRQQLRQALAIEHIRKEKLEELDRMKSRFFANISHEFRTPLTLILGLNEKLRKRASDEESKSDLGIMQKNARRLQRLIDQLLSLSKIEAGQMKLQAREENIGPLVRGYLQSFESAARQKSISTTFYSEKDDIFCYLDRDKLEKILYNLFSNAYKFTPVGGQVAVTVATQKSSVVSRQSSVEKINTEDCRLKTVDLSTRCAVISVADTGPGIPPEHLPHIFDRFYQADDSDTRFQEGSGIGLALTKELVELHHGKIDVVTESGKGSTFTVFLPLGKEHLKPDEIILPTAEEIDKSGQIKSVIAKEPEDSGQIASEKTSVIKGSRIRPIVLIVEDNIDMRYYLRNILEGSYRLIEAGNGKEGVELASEKIPDLVVSDVMMPEMDGYDLCHKLKNDECTSHIPVILLTAKAALEDRLEGLETGADDFITKPFQPQELLVRVKNLISQRQQLREKYRKEFEHLSLLPDKSLSSMDARFMERVRKVIEENLSNPEFDVVGFSRSMNLSRSQLHRKMIALFDLPATAFVRTYRLNSAARLLEARAGNVAEVAFEVGFNNLSYFSSCFRRQFGVNPSEYLAGNPR